MHVEASQSQAGVEVQGVSRKDSAIFGLAGFNEGEKQHASMTARPVRKQVIHTFSFGHAFHSHSNILPQALCNADTSAAPRNI